MHQEHNIPWNTLASNLKFIRENRHITPRITSLFALDRPTRAQELNYFTRTLTKTILTFSQTEREKYPRTLEPRYSGKLFPDELRDRYPEFLNQRNQLIEHWIARAKFCDRGGEERYAYHSGHGDLADIVKILINENELQPLLMLAQHPQIPLGCLRNLSWGHHFGFSRVAESALQPYFFFNVAAATNTLQDGEYQEVWHYLRMLQGLTSQMDYPAQQLPHRAFFGDNIGIRSVPPDAHSNLPRLQGYLKLLFSLLYRYDMIVRECGLDPEWEREIAESMPYLRSEVFPTENGWTGQFV